VRLAEALDIRAAPFFVVDGRYAVSGAQPPEVLRSALERAATGT
jgi:predicted DsbA family dithiol-disulfide isomerase